MSWLHIKCLQQYLVHRKCYMILYIYTLVFFCIFSILFNIPSPISLSHWNVLSKICYKKGKSFIVEGEKVFNWFISFSLKLTFQLLKLTKALFQKSKVNTYLQFIHSSSIINCNLRQKKQNKTSYLPTKTSEEDIEIPNFQHTNANAFRKDLPVNVPLHDKQGIAYKFRFKSTFFL